jgi:hypothetical protein
MRVVCMQKSIGMDIMLLGSCNCSINCIANDMEPNSTKKQDDDLTKETQRKRKGDYIVICYMIAQLLLEDGEAVSS